MSEPAKIEPKRGERATIHYAELLRMCGVKPMLEQEDTNAFDFNLAVIRQAAYRSMSAKGNGSGVRLDEDMRAIEHAAYLRGVREGVLLAVAELIANDLLEAEGLEL